VNLAKQVKFSVVGIDGKNIFDKNKNLTLCKFPASIIDI
jgi:hypothetical protein